MGDGNAARIEFNEFRCAERQPGTVVPPASTSARTGTTQSPPTRASAMVRAGAPTPEWASAGGRSRRERGACAAHPAKKLAQSAAVIAAVRARMVTLFGREFSETNHCFHLSRIRSLVVATLPDSCFLSPLPFCVRAFLEEPLLADELQRILSRRVRGRCTEFPGVPQ